MMKNLFGATWELLTSFFRGPMTAAQAAAEYDAANGDYMKTTGLTPWEFEAIQWLLGVNMNPRQARTLFEAHCASPPHDISSSSYYQILEVLDRWCRHAGQQISDSPSRLSTAA